jgi:hypothetical protein
VWLNNKQSFLLQTVYGLLHGCSADFEFRCQLDHIEPVARLETAVAKLLANVFANETGKSLGRAGPVNGNDLIPLVNNNHGTIS